MNQQKIGSFIRELRKEQGITQEQLAEQFNVSARTISRWEKKATVSFPLTAALYNLSLKYF